MEELPEPHEHPEHPSLPGRRGGSLPESRPCRPLGSGPSAEHVFEPGQIVEKGNLDNQLEVTKIDPKAAHSG